jgi:hypothetical protein
MLGCNADAYVIRHRGPHASNHWAEFDGFRPRTHDEQDVVHDTARRLRKDGTPPMKANERRLKIENLSALICVYPRPGIGFSASC